MRNTARVLAIGGITLLGVVTTIALGAIAGVAFACLVGSASCILALYRSTHPHDVPDERLAPQASASSIAQNQTLYREPEKDIPEENEPETDASTITMSTTSADAEEPPQAEQEEPQEEAPHDAFDFDAFQRSILFSTNPISTLVSNARSVRKQAEQGADVNAVSAFLARQIEELGIDENNEELAHVGITRLHRNGLFYLRAAGRRMSYGSYLQVLGLESALNALLFAQDYHQGLSHLDEGELYKVWQKTRSSICNQAPDVEMADWSYLAMPWQVPFGPADQGEWSVRHFLAEAIESLQLPYRLEVQFRCNVNSGDVAIEFAATPAHAFPRSAFVDGLGVVSTTNDMRRREAANYTCRVALLVANHAFRSSTKIRRVWISAIEETPSRRSCLLSACIGRRAFSQVRMESVSDPIATMRSLGASIEEEMGALLPTSPCFYLEDECFCPKMRYDLMEMSERQLSTQATQSLGTPRVSGLLIHEELTRAIAAESILRHMTSPSFFASTRSAVSAVMEAANNTSDLSVWDAAERVSKDLVNGNLSLDNPELLQADFVEGDSLTKAVERARSLLYEREPLEALDLILSALRPMDLERRYYDSTEVAYRCFGSFTERVIYNRLNAQDHRSIVLVPDTYLVAHLMASAILMSMDDEEGSYVQRALEHTRRALQIAPLNGPANLGMAACLEAEGKLDEAASQLESYLEVAYTPQGLGLSYYRLASIMWQLGNTTAARACCQRAVGILPALFPFAMAEFQELFGQTSQEGHAIVQLMDEKTMEESLERAGIPVAPTSRIAYILYDGATASIDAEVFPVARDIMRVLESLTGDDVIRNIRLSLEHEPDA